MGFIRAYVLSLFLLTGSAVLKAQDDELDFVRYSTGEGLSNSCVYDLYQDSLTGLLWIATEYGLNSFDGKKFTVYDSRNGLADNTIIGISQTSTGKLLFSPQNQGLYEPSGVNRFAPVRQYALSGNRLLHNDKLFLWTALYSPDLKTSLRVHYDARISALMAEAPRKEELVNGFAANGRHLLIARDSGLSLVNTALGTVKSFALYRGKAVHSVSPESPGIVYTTSYNLLRRFDYEHNAVLDSFVFSADEKTICNIVFTDSKKRTWAYSINTKRLFLIRKTGGVYRSVLLNDMLGLSETNVNKIIEDTEGNVWIATYNKGLYCIRNSPITKDKYLKDVYLNSVYIDSLGDTYLVSPKTIYLRTAEGGSQQISNQLMSGSYFYGVYVRGNALYIKGSLADISLGHKTIHRREVVYLTTKALAFYKNRLRITGSWSNHISIKDLGREGRTRILTFGQGLKENRINDVLIDGSKAWCATNCGLYSVDLEREEQIPLPGNKLITDKINAILIDDKRRLWFGASNALITCKGSSWKSFRSIAKQPISMITSLATDGKRIFIGTLTGLFIISEQDTLFMDQYAGLSSSEINGIAFDRKNNSLAIASNTGLSRLDLSGLYTGSKTGLNVLIDSLPEKEGCLQDRAGSYVFDRKPEKIRLSYTAVNFRSPHTVTYRYTIDGQAEQYTSQNQLEIVNLGYGRHTISIWASLNDKHWGQPAVIHLLIRTPFYLTWWFFLASGILLSGIFAWIVRAILLRHKSKLEKEHETERTIADLRHKALTGSINPHFVFNGFNSLQHYINSNNKPEALTFIGKFARLMRLILDHADSGTITVADELDQLTYYLEIEQMRFRSRFTYRIAAEDNVSRELVIPTMMIQPFVENAVLHAFQDMESGGCIDVNFSREGNKLHVRIEDNGVGIRHSATNKTHKSYALQNIRKRLAYHTGASLELKDKKDGSGSSGTLVLLTLPVSS